MIDRFRSMPMASSAVVAGRGATDLVVACAELGILMLTALAMGWRPDGGWGFLAAFGLLLWLRFSLIWIGVWLGLLVPNPEAAGGLFAVAFPLTMISSIFVAPQLMPDWLGWLASWNPVSSTAAATRDLFGTPVGGGDSWVEQHALLMAGCGPRPDGGLPAARGPQVPAAQPVRTASGAVPAPPLRPRRPRWPHRPVNRITAVGGPGGTEAGG
ncbi:hypothetical protein SHKM778_88910 [Streptomyces sp. KM77-8]|uniref:ABC-2 type transporter transmembrane domain-containing protein n=1 Tax=Streptomyces haneummycinicus TaxID=3074435 RepID=A0AAT9HXS5_9ACTN